MLFSATSGLSLPCAQGRKYNARYVFSECASCAYCFASGSGTLSCTGSLTLWSMLTQQRMHVYVTQRKILRGLTQLLSTGSQTCDAAPGFIVLYAVLLPQVTTTEIQVNSYVLQRVIAQFNQCEQQRPVMKQRKAPRSEADHARPLQPLPSSLQQQNYSKQQKHLSARADLAGRLLHSQHQRM